jgi:zinc transport system permease protein
LSEPRAVDEFDAILAEPARSASLAAGERPQTPPSAGGVPAATSHPRADEPLAGHAVHAEAPTFAEFARNWDLYRDPVLAGLFAGAALGVVGVFIVLRRAVFVTAAVSQAAGLGVAFAFLLAIHAELELPPVLLAFVFAGLAALVLALRPPARLPREATVSFLYLASSALAIIVGNRISQEAHDIAAILFGTAVLVRTVDLLLVGLVGAVALGATLAAARGLSFSGFDPDAARVQGLPVSLLEAGLWLIVAAEVAVATRALGALPVFAFAVLPAFAALPLSRRLPEALLIAGLCGSCSGALGYVAAFMLELPVGASQASLAALLALTAGAFKRFRRR